MHFNVTAAAIPVRDLSTNGFEEAGCEGGRERESERERARERERERERIEVWVAIECKRLASVLLCTCVGVAGETHELWWYNTIRIDTDGSLHLPGQRAHAQLMNLFFTFILWIQVAK